jgi:hypothetical protein
VIKIDGASTCKTIAMQKEVFMVLRAVYHGCMNDSRRPHETKSAGMILLFTI